MKKWCIVIFLSGLFLLPCSSIFAQDRKFVSATLINTDTKKPFDPSTVIDIYAFDTEALGEDAISILDENLAVSISGAYPVNPPDADGHFTCTLPETGALVIKVAGVKAHIEYIRYRSTLKISIAGGNRIVESQITASFTDKATVIEDESEVIADTLIAKYTMDIPVQVYSADNSRLILQPYFIEYQTGDTLARLTPYICDGKEYKLTQERRMDYNLVNDPLTGFVVEESLGKTGHRVAWRDSVWLPNPRKQYVVKGKLTIEDYNVITFVQDSLFLSSSRQRRPMQFLAYEGNTYHLDPEAYKEEARPEQFVTPGSMDLKFEVNRTSIDANDAEGRARLEELKTTLDGIVNDVNSWLREFHMESVSSPEGPYDKNVELSRKRLAYVSNYLLSDIPKAKMARVYHPKDTPTVATWTDVADSLVKDSLISQAEEIRKIVETHKNSRDRQWQAIKRLPYYNASIIPVLEKMRSVKYTYKHEVFRPLTPIEILRKYKYDEDYKSGKKHFKVYEYWELFRILEERGTDKDELFALYKRACDETAEDRGKSWIYAANKYAAACIERGIADTTILSPHIERSIPYSNFRKQNINDPRKWDLYNPAEVIANQLQMYLMVFDYPKAVKMANMLPETDEYITLKAVTMCRGGHYKGGKTPEDQKARARWFSITADSSPVNKAVMMLAMNTVNYDKKAEEAIKELSDDEALTWYLRAVISSRKLKDILNCEWDEPDRFREAMLKCFELDPKYVSIAYNDGDIDEQNIKKLLEDHPEYNKFK